MGNEVIMMFAILSVLGFVGILWLDAAKESTKRSHERYDAQKLEYLRDYRFSDEIWEKAVKMESNIAAYRNEIEGELLKYFEIAMSTGKPCGMPSEAVDALWHAFMLFSNEYTAFSKRVFGRYFHHTPNAGKSKSRVGDELKNTWVHCCEREGINPSKPHRLPALFEMDGKRLPANRGWHYLLNSTENAVYCATAGGGLGLMNGVLGIEDSTKRSPKNKEDGNSTTSGSSCSGMAPFDAGNDYGGGHSGHGSSHSDSSGSSCGSSCGGGCGS